MTASARTCLQCSGDVEFVRGSDGRRTCPACGAPDPEETAGPHSIEPTSLSAHDYDEHHSFSDLTGGSPPPIPVHHENTAPGDVPLPFSPAFLQEYRFIRVLGHGGMGAVYLMNQVKLDRQVAVKVVKSGEISSDQSSSLLKEAKVLAHLNHPAIVAIFDVGADGALTYMVSEYVEGETLAQRLRRSPPLTLVQSLRLAIHLLDGLKVAHKRGITHRDVKPGNILLDTTGKPKINDFGLARAQHIPSEMSAGKILGTPEYMSPEQCHGRAATAASDIYSTGVVLFELVTGQRPFRGPGLSDYLIQHARQPAPRARSINPDISEDLDELIARALEKDPGRRVRSAGDFRKSLLDIVRAIPIAREVTPTPAAASPGLRPATELTVGTLLSDRYELVRVLGQGGMGQVWLANDRARDGAEVAVKLLPPELWRDAESRACLVREGNLSLKLSHPSVVRLINLELADAPFLVMEYVPGFTLSEVLAGRTLENKGPLKPEEALLILEPVAAALDHAHERKVIHRDVKPSNVILETREDGGTNAKLADFGIAAEMASFATRSTGVVPMGTLLYMSPEQVACQRLDGRSDVYSLAATLYQMLTLSPPYYGGDVPSAIKHEPVPRPAGVSDAVAAVVMRAMAKSRDDRPQTAGALVAELRRAVDQGRVLGSSAGRAFRGPTPTLREMLLSRNARSLAIGMVAFLFALNYGLQSLRGPKPSRTGGGTSASPVAAVPATPTVVALASAARSAPSAAASVPVPIVPSPVAAAPVASPEAPANADALREAGEFYQQARYEEALSRYRAASSVQPNQPAILRREALCLVKLERPTEALTAIDRAVALSPRDATLVNTQVLVLILCGEVARALTAAQALVALPAPASDHWDTLGQAQRAAGRDGEARASFQKALALDPANVEADQNLRALE